MQAERIEEFERSEMSGCDCSLNLAIDCRRRPRIYSSRRGLGAKSYKSRFRSAINLGGAESEREARCESATAHATVTATDSAKSHCSR